MNMASKMKVLSENSKKSSSQFFVKMLFSEIEQAAMNGDIFLIKPLADDIYIDVVKQALVKEGFKVDVWISFKQIKISW